MLAVRQEILRLPTHYHACINDEPDAIRRGVVEFLFVPDLFNEVKQTGLPHKEIFQDVLGAALEKNFCSAATEKEVPLHLFREKPPVGLFFEQTALEYLNEKSPAFVPVILASAVLSEDSAELCQRSLKIENLRRASKFAGKIAADDLTVVAVRLWLEHPCRRSSRQSGRGVSDRRYGSGSDSNHNRFGRRGNLNRNGLLAGHPLDKGLPKIRILVQNGFERHGLFSQRGVRIVQGRENFRPLTKLLDCIGNQILNAFHRILSQFFQRPMKLCFLSGKRKITLYAVYQI